MPIVMINNFSKREILAAQAQGIVKMWSDLSGFEEEDITITVSKGSIEAGRNYQLIVHLYIASTVPANKIKVLQTSLAQSIAQSCLFDLNTIVIMTQIIQPGMILENGEVK